MTDAHVLNDKLSTFKYYEQKLPLYLQNSYGFKEHFRIWFDLLVQNGSPWFNQLVKNGNFVDISDWAKSGCNISANNNVLSATSTSTANSVRIQTKTPSFINGHKYFYTFTIKPPKRIMLLVNFQRATSGTATIKSSVYAEANTTNILNGIYSSSSDGYYLNIYFNRNQALAVSDVVEFSNVMVIDLTAIFGAGNEPATVEEFTALYPKDYYEYDPGSMSTNAIASTIDLLFEMLNIFDLNCTQNHPSGYESNQHFLSFINSIENSENGTKSDILDKIGNLFGLKRRFSIDVNGTTYELNLNNADFLTLIRCTIIKNYFDGSFEQISKYYKDAGLPVFVLTTGSAQCEMHLIDLEDSEYAQSADIQKMFLAGLLTVESVGISYTYSIHTINNLAIFDSEDSSNTFDNGVMVI